MKPQVTTITQKIIIPATPTQVYEAFVNPTKHSEFTGSKATGKPKIGAKFTTWDGYSFGKFLELEKGKRLVQTWQTTDWPEGYGPSRFELTFKPIPEGTEITMTQTDVPTEQQDELADGWKEFYWKPLKTYFKKPKPTKSTQKP